MSDVRSALITTPGRRGIFGILLPEAAVMVACAAVVARLEAGFAQTVPAALTLMAMILLAYFAARMVGLYVEAVRIRKDRAATHQRSLALTAELQRSFQPRP